MFGDKVSPVLLISRRTLLRHAIVAGASSYIFVLSVSASSDSAKREYSDAAGRTYLYVANSGEATGVLFARDLIRHQQFFEDLRKKHSYYLKLKYHGTNRYQLPYALDVIDYFVLDPDFSLIAYAPIVTAPPSRDTKQRTSSDLTQIQLQQQRLRELIRLGLDLRSDTADR